MLESTISAVELGIPLAMLDNACSPWRARILVAVHASIFDGIILNGPSSLHPRRPPKYYCAASPYIDGSPEEAEALLNQSGIRPKRWITVLAYEKNIQQLAVGLLPSLAGHDCASVFVTPSPRDCGKLLSALAPQFAERIIVLPPPSDNLLFGLLKFSSLVIGRCDFTQMSEALALGAPFLGVTNHGCFPVRFPPRRMRRFIHLTGNSECDKATAEATLRLMLTPRNDVLGIHDGRFGAATAADFLECLPAAHRITTPSWRIKEYSLKRMLNSIPERIFEGTYAAAQALASPAPRLESPSAAIQH